MFVCFRFVYTRRGSHLSGQSWCRIFALLARYSTITRGKNGKKVFLGHTISFINVICLRNTCTIIIVRNNMFQRTTNFIRLCRTHIILFTPSLYIRSRVPLNAFIAYCAVQRKRGIDTHTNKTRGQVYALGAETCRSLKLTTGGQIRARWRDCETINVEDQTVIILFRFDYCFSLPTLPKCVPTNVRYQILFLRFNSFS